MASGSLAIKLIIVAIVLYGAKVLLTPKRKANPLPPGPKGWPLVSNLADFPPAGTREWEHWGKHKDLYVMSGPISSVTVFGTTIVILSHADMAFELMEKRGTKYSSRPQMVFAMEMCGWKHMLASQLYTERLRQYRQQFHKIVGTKAALSRFYPLQDMEVHRFLLRVLDKPEDLIQHVRTVAGAIILKMAYGYTVEPHNPDPLVDIADRGLDEFTSAIVPGAWLVDSIPALRYLPEWMPGAGFKKTAREWHATMTELVERPMRFVKQQMAAGKNEASFVSDLYEKAGGEMTADDEDMTKWSAASFYTGGADTSVSTMSTFFLAMTLNPSVQARAQEEIDRVIGTHRFPSFSDRDNLPYVEAVIKEAFRWHPVGPMGLPHVATEDGVCSGYLIPKGALVVPNIRLYTHDNAIYADPESFNPSRFLTTPPPRDPRDYIFGFGRRVCPGKLLADFSVWLTVATSLAAFDVRKGVGAEIGERTAQFMPGIISHPYPFKADIRPRSAKHEKLIRNGETEHPWEESHAEVLRKIKL